MVKRVKQPLCSLKTVLRQKKDKIETVKVAGDFETEDEEEDGEEH